VAPSLDLESRYLHRGRALHRDADAEIARSLEVGLGWASLCSCVALEDSTTAATDTDPSSDFVLN